MKRIFIKTLFSIFVIFSLNATAGSYGWQSQQLGFVGGTGGYDFSDKLSSRERICGIYVNHGSRISGLQIQVCDNSGNRYLTEQRGKNTGTRSYFQLNSDEQLHEVIISSGKKNGNLRIFGLSF